MRETLAGLAVVAWGLGVMVAPLAGVLWTRDRRHWLGLVALVAALLVQAAWVATAIRRGVGIVADAGGPGIPAGWGAWAAGIGGFAALVSAVVPRSRSAGRRGSDRLAELAAGLFGLGILLRQLALAA